MRNVGALLNWHRMGVSLRGVDSRALQPTGLCQAPNEFLLLQKYFSGSAELSELSEDAQAACVRRTGRPPEKE